MKTRPALALILTLVLAACGGAPGSTTKNQPGATQKPGGGTAVDCTKMKAAAASLIGIQYLAQLTTPESIDTIKTISAFDLEGLITSLGDLHALDAVSSPFGNAKASIDAYEKAARAAKQLLAMNPVTQAAIDAYNRDNVGTVADFLGKQVAISGAMGEAGC